MKRINKKDDLKFHYPLLTPQGVLSKPKTNLKFIFYTGVLKKKVATIDYKQTLNNITGEIMEEHTCTNCYFKDLVYINPITNIKQVGPVLIIHFNEPNLKPGKLHCKLYLNTSDKAFQNSDNKYKKIKKIDTNIEII